MELEWKNKFTAGSVLLHVLSAALIIYLTFGVIEDKLWTTLFWMVILFSTLNGISRGFVGMRRGNFLYYRQLVTPEAFITGKILFHFILMFLFSATAWVVFAVFYRQPDFNSLFWLLTVLLTGYGLSTVFTVISAIAARTDNGSLLVPILSLPVLIPVILVGIKTSDKLLLSNSMPAPAIDWLVLLALNITITFAGILLFKFVWQD